jgi:adenine deaminase
MAENTFSLSGKFVDVHRKEIRSGELFVRDGVVEKFVEGETSSDALYMPGLVDAHIHIESSLLVPTEFARLATPHGTVATVSDPHEIANVLGVEGVQYMLDNTEKTPLKILFGAPSCVPATCNALETAGSVLGIEEVRTLLENEQIGYLAEVMNFPGVLNNDEVVHGKIALARKLNKPIDGHFPGGRGDEAKRYIEAGHQGEATISTDHECFTLNEALDKLSHGMKISIREGSAAQNLEALHELFARTTPDRLMLCSDDRHPDTLVKGHVNELLRRLVAKGYDPLDLIISATKTPVEHYNLDVGLLQPGDPADFIQVKDLEHFEVVRTFIDGHLVAENGRSLLESHPIEVVNNFNRSPISETDLRVTAHGKNIRVIEVLDGEIVTEAGTTEARSENGEYLCDTERDLLKLVVVNRYGDTPPAVAFARGFQLKHGALASSVGHDCHNIIAVGTNDADIVQAINGVIEHQGGLSLAKNGDLSILPLPVAGIMSDRPAEEVTEQYTTLDQQARALGSPLRAPYMSLSFLALLVIPELKLSDKGLFDGKRFGFVPLYVD